MYYLDERSVLYKSELNVTDYIKIVVQVKQLRDVPWITISKARKWQKDDKFRFVNTVMMDFELFKESLFPVLKELSALEFPTYLQGSNVE